MTDVLLHRLRRIVGEPHVLCDPETRAPYEHDWTRRFGGCALAVVRPETTDQVAQVLSTCRDHGVSVVPQGGNTGLVGGGVPRGGEVVVSTRRMTNIRVMDRALGLVVAEAGATLAALQRTADGCGWYAGLDFAARDSATIGGIVACDAGGTRALRYGTARRRVLGLEAILSDGSVISRMRGLPKDNAGLDVASLVVGSEGTLALVTRVIWQLVPREPIHVTALLTVPNIASARELVGSLRTHAPSLAACEFMMHSGVELVLKHRGLSRPVAAAPLYLLVELASTTDPMAELAQALEGADVLDVAVATDDADRRRLWTLREELPDAIARLGVTQKIDVGVPLAQLDNFLARLPEIVQTSAPEAEAFAFGHLADGNVHVNVVGCDPADHSVEDAVLAVALGLGGTISAEHGVGIAKVRHMSAAFGPADRHAMSTVKQALDATDTMNPGVLYPVVEPR